MWCLNKCVCRISILCSYVDQCHSQDFNIFKVYCTLVNRTFVQIKIYNWIPFGETGTWNIELARVCHRLSWVSELKTRNGTQTKLNQMLEDLWAQSMHAPSTATNFARLAPLLWYGADWITHLWRSVVEYISTLFLHFSPQNPPKLNAKKFHTGDCRTWRT